MDLQSVSHAAKKNKQSLEHRLAASLLATVSQLAVNQHIFNLRVHKSFLVCVTT